MTEGSAPPQTRRGVAHDRTGATRTSAPEQLQLALSLELALWLTWQACRADQTTETYTAQLLQQVYEERSPRPAAATAPTSDTDTRIAPR